MNFQNVAVTLALQTSAVLLTQLSSGARRYFDLFFAQSPLLHTTALLSTAFYSISIIMSYTWIANRWSPRAATASVLLSSSFFLVFLTIAILPFWRFDPQSLVALANKACSFKDYVKISMAAMPFIQIHALLSIYSIFALTFAFWQVLNTSFTQKQARTFYPLLTLSFGGLHFLANHTIQAYVSKIMGFNIILPACLHIPYVHCILALTPVALVFIWVTRWLPSKDFTKPLKLSTWKVFRQCLSDKKLAPFTMTNTLGMIIIGILMHYVIDINALAHNNLIARPNHWPTYNSYFVWAILIGCSILSYVVMNLFSASALLTTFAGITALLGVSVAIFLPSKNVPVTLSVLYGMMAIKACKHALFTTPKQILYQSWDPEMRFKGKAFFDICVDRFAFVCGAVAYSFIAAVNTEYGWHFYRMLGCTIALLSLLMLCYSRKIQKP